MLFITQTLLMTSVMITPEMLKCISGYKANMMSFATYLKVFGSNAVILRLNLSESRGEVWEAKGQVHLGGC